MHVFRFGFLVMAPHSLKVQRRRAHTSNEVGRELWINGLGGSETMLARPGGGWDGDGIVAKMRRHSIPNRLVEAVIVAKVRVIAAKAAIELAWN